MTTEYSIQKMVSDGTLSTIALGIQYLQRNDIYIRIAGEETPQSGASSGYTWAFLDSTTLKILPVVPSGIEVVVYRRTDVDTMYNIYSQNAQFDEATIDENNQQLLYIAQEYLEQGIPGAGVEAVEYLRQVGNVTYYRMRLTDGSYTNEFYIVAPLPAEGAHVDTIAELRNTIPLVVGKLIDVVSYYGGWGAVNGGQPAFGGRFWYDANDNITPDDGYKTIVTLQGQRWKRVRGKYSIGHAGAREDESFDSTAQVQAAINGTKSGEELGFYGGPYMFTKVNLTKPIVLVGDAKIIHNGFIVKSSRVYSKLSGQQICLTYSGDNKAFHCLAYEDAADYEDIRIISNNFSGFFYSTDFRGRAGDASETDPANRVIKGLLIIGCTSIAPTAVGAGHFQNLGITNLKLIGNSTYGGAGATSYNVLNGNGYVIVQGNYDEGNTYGSCEIENNKGAYCSVTGNVFGKQIWIDDSDRVTVSGNVVNDVIFITAQQNDTDNVVVSGNVCARVSITKFGASPTGRHKSVKIVGNTCFGLVGSSDIFVDDSADSVTIENNDLNGETDNAISIGRGTANCNHLIRNNRSRVLRPLGISGSGGRIVEYGNDNMTISGTTDSKHLSNLMRQSVDYLDVPGMYLHGSKYAGTLAPGASAGISLPIPDSGTLSFRTVALWVMFRDTANNNFSSYRLDANYKVVGSASLSFGTAYSTVGPNATGSITISNNASTTNSINLLVTNASGSITFQVTIVPEVSSRLGIEE